ncbi:MAG: PEGA domain-containing protein [Planctomycetota bacterium]
MSMREIVRPALVGVLAAVLLAGTGCVKRSLLVKSDPPGAAVFIDDKEVGTTPVTVPFYHYGYREVRLEKDGYETKTEIVRIKAPASEVYPLDFFADVLLPTTIYDRRQVSFSLDEREAVEEDKLMERAIDMRQDMVHQTGGPPATATAPATPSENEPPASNPASAPSEDATPQE